MTAKQLAFIAAYKETASITKAAEAATVDRSLHYESLANEEYAAAFATAKQEATQTLEDEAIRRAHEGTLRPVFHKGKPCGVTREYSDTLMMFLLKGFNPQKFKDRAAVEHSGIDGKPIAIDGRLAALTDDELTQLELIAEKLTTATGHPSGTTETEPQPD